MVEAQHLVSTRRLVDSADEQALLEQLIDRVKPPAPAGPYFRGLHYLLMTPFRHPPLPYGSRFGTRRERGLFYASEALHTTFAETAYYRFLFLSGSRAVLPRLMVELTAFRVHVRTQRGMDLSRPPFDKERARIASRTRYRDSQTLGAKMRGEGIKAFRYPSARDPERGTNIGVFTPKSFRGTRPHGEQVWLCDLTAQRAEFTRKNVLAAPERYEFQRRQFEVREKLPAPSV